MARPIGALLALLLFFALLAGCASPVPSTSGPTRDGSENGAPAPSPASHGGNATTNGGAPQAAPASREVYWFSGTLTGVSAPSESGRGAEVDWMPATKIDRFEAPAGTTDLLFQASYPRGVGSTRTEVLGPDGQYVFSSTTYTKADGPLGGPQISSGGHTTPGLGAGNYTVLYYVAGSMAVGLRVTATIPADTPPPATEEVYQFSGYVVGANAPDLRGNGATVEEIPLTKQAQFLAPVGTRTLDISVERAWTAVGLARVEVTGPNGALVYKSPTWAGDGAGGFCVLITCSQTTWGPGETGAGIYVVSYYVAGAFDFNVHVRAILAPHALGASNGTSGAVWDNGTHRVYQFTGQVTGTGVSEPVGGRLGTRIPGVLPARQETFEAPPGTDHLHFSVRPGLGFGAEQVEVHDPDGKLVYASPLWYHEVGSTCALGCGGFYGGPTGPGTYTISYYVAGTVAFKVRIDAIVA